MKPRLGTLVLGTMWMVGCRGPRTLETRIGTHRTEYLQAQAVKAGDQWQVELTLPAGTWTVIPGEAQAVELVPGTPRATLRWRVLPERWRHQDKPFEFTLQGEGGMALRMSVKYPNTVPGGVVFLLDVLSRSSVRF